MKILAEDKDFGKRILLPGDSFQVVYTKTYTKKQGLFRKSKAVKKEDEVLCTHSINKYTVIDYVAVAELEESELSALGLEKGLAGIVGKKK